MDTVPAAGQTTGRSNEVVDTIDSPGATRSGFCRPSRVGPGLENVDRFSLAGVPVNDVAAPLHAVHDGRVTYDPTVITSAALPGSVISSRVGWLPATKLAV